MSLAADRYCVAVCCLWERTDIAEHVAAPASQPPAGTAVTIRGEVIETTSFPIAGAEVQVVTGYRRVEDGFVLRPVVHWVPTITTEPTDFDLVKVGSEFGTIETRLAQDGYWNPNAPAGQKFREYFIEGIDYHVEAGAGRKLGLQLGDRRLDFVHHRDRVGLGELRHPQRDAFLAVHAHDALPLLVRVFHGGDVAQVHRPAGRGQDH